MTPVFSNVTYNTVTILLQITLLYISQPVFEVCRNHRSSYIEGRLLKIHTENYLFKYKIKRDNGLHSPRKSQ